MNFITLKTSDGFAMPALYVPSTKGAGRPLVLIQEIFGINPAMQAAANAWAAEGFDVVVPDLFARSKPGIQLDPTKPEEFKQGIDLMMAMDQEQAVRDLDAAREWFVAQGKGEFVGALGYCLGGRLAVMMALSTKINATVSYYGVGLEGLIPAEKVAAAPCLLHIAEKDGFVPAEARAVILKNAVVQAEMPAHVYPGCDHAFARPNGEHYDAAAANLARERTLAFLQR